MDWFSSLEQKRRFTLIAIILLMVATIAVTSLRDPRTLDGFWHLKMGQDWIENGLSPWQDHYSFTYQGEEINSPPVVFQVTLYWLVKHFGVDGGFKLFKFLSMMLVLVMMLWWLHRIKSPVLVYCLVLPLVVTMLQFRATVRPELISYAFLVLAVILYEKVRSKFSFENMLAIAVLMLVWNNYHSSIFGYIVFMGLFIDLGLNQIKQGAAFSAWLKWSGWGLLIVGLGFVNPSMTHPLIAAITFPDEWKSLIQEYNSPLMYKNVPSLYVLIFIAFVTLFLCWKQKLYGYLFICVFLLINAATMARLVAPTGLVVLCIFALVATQLDYSRLLETGNRYFRVAIPLGAVLVFVVPLLNSVINARAFVAQNRETSGLFPYAMVEYMKDSGRAGRIFNEYDMGGFLIYQLAPDSQVYIDGRTNILYPLEHYQRQQGAFASADVLIEEIEKYDVQYVITRSTSDKALLVEQTGLMKLDYADLRYFLYSRKDANVPTAGTLWARPYCWKENDTGRLIEEGATAAIYFTPDTQLHPFIKLMTDYGDSHDRPAFLEQQRETVYWPDASKRFVGYQAMKLGNFELARQHFMNVTTKDPKDFLATALSELRMGQPGDAEATLSKALNRTWNQLEFRDMLIMHALLSEVREKQGWRILDDSYLDHFADQVKDKELTRGGNEVDAATFCVDFD